ncbi:MAG TPA: 2'-5' RNA ligase family protein [Gillisia sp.]|nr:2'-5' RNA ligase family protein [Gillisia sp.]
MKTYFVALVPSPPLLQEIIRIKESFAKTYGARHALKLPPHITLIAPFKINQEAEPALLSALQQTADKTSAFDLELNGYDAFAPRVIFIKVLNPQPVKRLYDALYVIAGAFLPPKPERELHPHITIATRDLSMQAFEKAMPVFQKEEFQASFHVNSILLFGHKGKTWEIIEEFPFN